MSIYNTKQRRALLAFLGEHPDKLLTARQMADALAAQSEQFTLDAADTILYGTCLGCKEK